PEKNRCKYLNINYLCQVHLRCTPPKTVRNRARVFSPAAFDRLVGNHKVGADGPPFCAAVHPPGSYRKKRALNVWLCVLAATFASSQSRQGGPISPGP